MPWSPLHIGRRWEGPAPARFRRGEASERSGQRGAVCAEAGQRLSPRSVWGVAVWAYFDRGQSARNPSQEAIFWSVWSCTNRSPETVREKEQGLWAFPGSSCWVGGSGSGRCLCCPRVVLSNRFLLAGTVAVRNLVGWAGLGCPAEPVHVIISAVGV